MEPFNQTKFRVHSKTGRTKGFRQRALFTDEKKLKESGVIVADKILSAQR
jgi:hypothetical protein